MNNFQKISEMIQKAEIAPHEKNNIILLLEKATESDLDLVLELFMSDQSWISKISRNFSSKRDAILTGDKNMWQRIIEDEANYLKNID